MYVLGSLAHAIDLNTSTFFVNLSTGDLCPLSLPIPLSYVAISDENNVNRTLFVHRQTFSYQKDESLSRWLKAGEPVFLHH